MEFLDSLDLDTNYKKAHRVRSWYLYEQYKSLEKHQLDAVQKLKDRSYQDKILRQELSERRARRKLYDQFGLCQSESRINRGNKRDDTLSKTLSVSNDEFFESFSEQEDERVTQETVFDNQCSKDLTTDSYCDMMEDFKNITDKKDCISRSDSVNSVVEKLLPNNELDECSRENQIASLLIAQDLNKQFDSVKQNIQNLESITKFGDCKSSDSDSDCFCDENSELADEVLIHNKQKKINHIIFIWSRLVSFAYQVVQLNHGNCYCDYSSQFLTAVLACDVLRRGVNRMCYALQPYVSPIKFASEESDESVICCKMGEIKKSVQSRKSKKTFEKKLWHRSKRSDKQQRHAYKNNSQGFWECCCGKRRSLESNNPWSTDKMLRRTKIHFKEMSSSSSSSLRPRIGRKNKSKNRFNNCDCYNRALNPMLEIARYIDRILKDTKECAM